MKSVINLVKTSQGYSLLQGNIEVNKSAGSKSSKEKASTLPKKFAHQNFTIYPYIYGREGDAQRYLVLPARAQWFNMHSVHELEKKALPEWFKIKKGILASINNVKFEKHQELYKKYRNYIIELGKHCYLSPTASRKGLAGDASAILRIHAFLEREGLINYLHKKPTAAGDHTKTAPHVLLQQGESITQPSTVPPTGSAGKPKDSFDRDKLIVSRSYNKDDLELLKKITLKHRPVCHFCNGIVGIVWYEYTTTYREKLFKRHPDKKSCTIVEADEPKQYLLRVCASCIQEGNIPIMLCQQDFVKNCVMDELDEFVKKHGGEIERKKTNELTKIADAVEKNKFNLRTSALALKMDPQILYKILMVMPMQKLEKISRIDPQTDIEETKQQLCNHKNGKSDSKIPTEATNGYYSANNACKTAGPQQSPPAEHPNVKKQFKYQMQCLEHEQRQLYEQFLQSWLIKTNAKLLRLQTWETSVVGKLRGLERFQKNHIADKLKQISSKLV